MQYPCNKIFKMKEKVCRHLIGSIFQYSTKWSVVYARLSGAFVSDDYCQSFSMGEGCMYWNGKECTDSQKWDLKKLKEFYKTQSKKFKQNNKIIMEI